MMVVDADKGTILAELPIGRGSDGCVFDADRGLAFSSNGGDGTLDGSQRREAGQVRRCRNHSDAAGCSHDDDRPEDAPGLPLGGDDGGCAGGEGRDQKGAGG